MFRIDLPPLVHAEAPGPGEVADWIRTPAVIAGVEHVIDLLAVHLDETGVQRAATPELDEMLGCLHLAVGGDGPFATIEIEGLDYVLVMTPTCT